MPVSCYIRTFNEVRKIGDVVAAAREVADEVIVVDSGSADTTIAIAEAQGARVIRQAWLGRGRQKRSPRTSAATTMCSISTPTRLVSPGWRPR